MPRRSEEWWLTSERDEFLWWVGYFMGLAATRGDTTIARVAALLRATDSPAVAPPSAPGDADG